MSSVQKQKRQNVRKVKNVFGVSHNFCGGKVTPHASTLSAARSSHRLCGLLAAFRFQRSGRVVARQTGVVCT